MATHPLDQTPNEHHGPPSSSEMRSLVLQVRTPVFCGICKETIGEFLPNTSVYRIVEISMDHLATIKHRREAPA